MTLQDNELVQIADLGSNFYCEEAHVGKVTRADASINSLSDLNGYVRVEAYKGEITQEFLSNFDIVVFTEFFDQKKLEEFNDFCHSKNIAFIFAGALGLYGFAFVDFGEKHVISDSTGE